MGARGQFTKKWISSPWTGNSGLQPWAGTIKNTTKHITGGMHGAQCVRDAMAMGALAAGGVKVCDAQSAHEKTLSGLLTALVGANIVYGVGMLESGMTYSPAQLVIDNEIYTMIKRIMGGIPVNDLTIDLETIDKVGPGGSYLTAKTTVKNMRGLHSVADIFDRRNRANWLEAGGLDSYEKARDRATQIIKEHKPSVPLSEEIKSTLRTMVEDAEAEFRALQLMK